MPDQPKRERSGTTRSMMVNHFAGRGGERYELRHGWPADCFVQGGHDGIVFTAREGQKRILEEPVAGVEQVLKALRGDEDARPHYTTAYFEAFPKPPHDTFIRGEGKTLEAAEDAAWAKWLRIEACQHAEFERRKRRDGYGYCVGCGMGKARVFEPLTKCHACGKPTNWSCDAKGEAWGCEEHSVGVGHAKK